MSLGLDTTGKPLIPNVATYTPVYFKDGKCHRGDPLESAEAAWEVIKGWKEYYQLDHPTAVEVNTKKKES